MAKEPVHWADRLAEVVVKDRRRKTYTCAAGISPSGTIHFGNFREVMTAHTVYRGLKEMGKKARFIYSWDDYDCFRKVPAGIDKKFEQYLGMPYVDVPDPDGEHDSYAERNEKKFEESLRAVGIEPEFKKQSEMYRKCKYKEGIKTALLNRGPIRDILNKYREKPLPEEWYPLVVYCQECKKNNTKVLDYDGEYTLTYECKCGNRETINFSKNGIVKLPWRVDWPMRQAYEKVDFEPGGKEHSTPGGSRTTAKEIIEQIYGSRAPVYRMYDFIILKGQGGKMSGSLGNVITLDEVLEVYEPDIVKWLFTSTRPNKEFFVSFDLDVIKTYEDFDRCERIYYRKEKLENKKRLENEKRNYKLAATKTHRSMPLQPSFRHLSNIIQIHNEYPKIKEEYKDQIKNEADEFRLKMRVSKVTAWLESHAPEEFKFSLNEKTPENLEITEKEREALCTLGERLEKKKFDEKSLSEEFYKLSKEEFGIEPKKFFLAAYKVLINKARGPKLAPFILLAKERSIKLFKGL